MSDLGRPWPTGPGQVHQRPDGSGECGYLAEVVCNKCGWVDPALPQSGKDEA